MNIVLLIFLIYLVEYFLTGIRYDLNEFFTQVYPYIATNEHLV